MDSVYNYEPHLALFAEDSGLYFYKKIILQSEDYLRGGGYIAFEIGYNQAHDIKNMLIENGFDDIKVIKDYSNLDRIITAKKC